MLSNYTLEGEEEGIFARYWRRVKAFIPQLLALPQLIKAQRARVASLLARARRAGDRARGVDLKLAGSRSRLRGMAITANKVVAKIKKYLPTWRKKEEEVDVRGVGLIPVLIFGVAAGAALAYVGVKGLSLLKQYKMEERIISDMENQLITIEEAKQLIKATKERPAGLTIETGLGVALPVLAISGALVAYRYFGKKIS